MVLPNIKVGWKCLIRTSINLDGSFIMQKIIITLTSRWSRWRQKLAKRILSSKTFELSCRTNLPKFRTKLSKRRSCVKLCRRRIRRFSSFTQGCSICRSIEFHQPFYTIGNSFLKRVGFLIKAAHVMFRLNWPLADQPKKNYWWFLHDFSMYF